MFFAFPSKTPESSIQFATIISVFLVIIKGLVGFFSGSLAILGSALDSGMDIFVSSVNFFILKISKQEKTGTFSYGYGKAQGFGAIFEGIIILVSGVLLVFRAIESYRTHAIITITLLELGVMILALAGSFLIVWNFRQVKKRHSSLLLDSDMLHYSSDIFMNSGVLLSLAGMYLFGWWWLDVLSGGIIGLFIIWNSLEILKRAMHMLLDHSLSAENLTQIENIISAYTSIESYHNLRTRESGDDIFLEVHLVFRDKKILLSDAHDTADAIEQDLMKLFPRVCATLHLEINDSEPERK